MFDLVKFKRPDALKVLDWFRKDLNDVDTWFDNLSHFHGLPTLSGLTRPSFSPSLQIIDNENEYLTSVELPGLEEKDVDISIDDDNILTIKGEKKQTYKEEKNNYYVSEISYGAFRREIPLPQDIEKNNIEALFSKGILAIKFPKVKKKEKEVKKIEVKTK
jgi:HSP20 family protein